MDKLESLRPPSEDEQVPGCGYDSYSGAHRASSSSSSSWSSRNSGHAPAGDASAKTNGVVRLGANSEPSSVSSDSGSGSDADENGDSGKPKGGRRDSPRPPWRGNYGMRFRVHGGAPPADSAPAASLQSLGRATVSFAEETPEQLQQSDGHFEATPNPPRLSGEAVRASGSLMFIHRGYPSLGLNRRNVQPNDMLRSLPPEEVAQRLQHQSSGGPPYPLDSDGNPTSRGSVGHNDFTCSPCIFWQARRRCASELDCGFCHLEHRPSSCYMKRLEYLTGADRKSPEAKARARLTRFHEGSPPMPPPVSPPAPADTAADT